MRKEKHYVHKSDKLTHRTLSGVFWMLSGNGMQALLQFFILIVLARLVSKGDFGLASASLILVGLSDIFSQLGVGPAIVQRSEISDLHIRLSFTVSLVFGALFSFLTILFSENISNFMNMPDLAPLLRWTSLIFTLNGLSVVAESLLQRELNFKKLSAANVYSYAISFILIALPLAYKGYGVWALVAGYLSQAVFKSAFLLYYQPHQKKIYFDSKIFKELMYFGGWFTVARIGNYAALQGDNFVVGKQLGEEPLGLYSRAYQIMTMPALLVGKVIDKVLFPAMAAIQHESERLAKVYQSGIALMAVIFLPMSAFSYFLAPEIIHVILGKKWDDAIVPFQILALGTLFRTSYKISDSLTRATGDVFSRAWRQWVYAGMVILGAYIGSKWNGIIGVSWGTFTALSVNFVMMAHLSLQVTRLSWKEFLVAHFPAVALTIIVGTEAWLISEFLQPHLHAGLILLIIGGLAWGITFVALFILAPKIFFGEHAVHIIRTILIYITKNNKFLKRFVVSEKI